MRNKIILLLSGIAVITAAILVFAFLYQPANNLEVDFLDVGQGDAILIKSPYGQNILIDGGPNSSVIKRLAENLAWWERRIDLMVLTHPHDDHVGGLVDVVRRYRVKKALYSGVLHSGPAYLAWLELVKSRKIPAVIVDRPQSIKLGPDCHLDILSPRENLSGAEVENLNNSSIVIRLVYKQTAFLFVGDTESDSEKEMAGREIDLRADVLKVGHHGSDNASGEEFLGKVLPLIAVIQVGKNNNFGHPSYRVLKRLERTGTRIFRTDIDSTVKLVSDGENVIINN